MANAALVDRITGLRYTNLTRIAKADTVQLFIWKQAPSLWRYLVWDLEDGTVRVVGPQYDTKRDALSMADEYLANSWGITGA